MWMGNFCAGHAVLEHAEGHAGKDIALLRTADVPAALPGTVAADDHCCCLPYSGHLLLVHFGTKGKGCPLKHPHPVALDLHLLVQACCSVCSWAQLININ